MKLKQSSVAVAVAVVALLPTPARAAGTLQRFALVVGANAGGADRPQLQYAVSDAERFGRVLVELGGVAPAHAIVLRQPKLRDLADAFDLLTRHVNEARRVHGSRTEVIVYYSGHADEKGLLFGDDRYSYRTLRDRLDAIPADVRIAVLDACSSGAFTRIKSGRPRPAFLVDESSDMRGHAFLTSSSENEAAQESDRIRASYFTHYLISGFRGAADTSGDGKVTLNEAYQFAFNETLRRTVDTRGGAQHPSYDINMSGTGDVVMTDVRQTTATLVLGEELDGRFFIRTAATHELVVELYKPRGRTVELAIEPGPYDVRVEREKESLSARTDGEKESLSARTDVAEGARVTIDSRQLTRAALEPTRPRGEAPAAADAASGSRALDRRQGLELISGALTVPEDPHAAVNNAVTAVAGWRYSKYFREDLALTVSVESVSVKGLRPETAGEPLRIVGGISVPVGIRWMPFTDARHPRMLRPFVDAGGGPTAAYLVGRGAGDPPARRTLSAYAGGGLDVLLSRSFSVGLTVHYNAMPNFSEPVGGRDNFNGALVTFDFGWVFGKGRQ